MKSHIVMCLAVLVLLVAPQADAQNKDAAKPPVTTSNTDVQNGGAVNDQKRISDAYLPEGLGPGRTLTVHGSFEDAGAWRLILTNIEEASIHTPPIPGDVAADKKSLSFSLPNNLKEGRYLAAVELDAGNGTPKKFSIPGELRIPAAAALKVTVDKVQPKDAYPYPNSDGKYDFEISGTNFARNLADNHVEINGVAKTMRCHGCPSTATDPELLADAGNETTKLIVHDYTPPGYSNPLEVAVRVGSGDNVAKAPNPLMFSSISRDRLQVYAIGSFVLIVATLFLLVQMGAKRLGGKFWSPRAFLIDQDTNSYSLSKFQLTLFTLVTIFGYIYVFVCHLYVQWKFALPPVPEGLPTMLGLSVGTSVVAAGIGARIGGKGAGPESPSMADFVSSGGVVLPERFQFFLWTIVSSGGILALILASDPATVTQLPKLPDGMLYLMGLSSAGYLGGKLVRGPGPSIRSIDVDSINKPIEAASAGKQAKPARRALQATITGDNLSPSATFQLDDEKIPADQVVIDSRQDDVQQPQFCSMLRVHLESVADRFFEGDHALRITNPDSQGAEITYGTKITSVTQLEQPPGVTRIKLSVKGVNFKDPSQGSWVNDAGAQPATADIPVADITKVSDTEIAVTLPEGATLPGKLTIKSPGNLTTTVPVKS